MSAHDWGDWPQEVPVARRKRADKVPPESLRASGKTTAKSVDLLNKAVEIQAARGKVYDDKTSQERSMAKIVATFNSCSGHKLTERDGWVFMTCLKLVRADGDNAGEDHYVDMISYASLLGECSLQAPQGGTL